MAMEHLQASSNSIENTKKKTFRLLVLTCDRCAAHFKGHFRRKVNSGFNITNSLEVTQSFMNVPNVIALQSELTGNVQKPNLEIENISTLNNFLFNEQGIKCWRQYKIGGGNNIMVPNYVHKGCIKKLSTDCKVIGNPEYIEEKHPTKRQKKEKENQNNEPEDPEDLETSLIYICPEQCTKIFLNYGNLQRHLDIGKHAPIKKCEKLSDRSKIIFRKISDQSTPRHLQISDIRKEGSSTTLPIYELGFALKVRKKAKRFNKAQRDYLDDIFNEGRISKKHASAAEVAKKMMKAKTKDGKRMFKKEEYLTESQIKGYFSRRAAKIKNKAIDDDDSLDAIMEEEYLKDHVTKVRKSIPY